MTILEQVTKANDDAAFCLDSLRQITERAMGTPIERCAVPHLLKRARELQADIYALKCALEDSK